MTVSQMAKRAMSARMARAVLEVRSLRHACPRCRAVAGQKCMRYTRIGRKHRRYLLALRHPHAERTALVFPVWRKGDKDPEARNPLRHPRRKALLLLDSATGDDLRNALRVLIDRDPLPVLTALADVIAIREDMT